MLIFIHSEPGYAHINEDVVLVQPLAAEGEMLLCALADGQGGQFGGGEAAKCAAHKSLEVAATFDLKSLLDEQIWLRIVGAADEFVEETPNAGYTTLICLAIQPGRLCGASCGDSAVLLLNEGKERLLTRRQVKNPPVGFSAADPVAFSAALGNVWKVAIMSDGVWKYVGWERLGELMRQHDGKALIEAMREVVASGWGSKLPDDFSIILLESN